MKEDLESMLNTLDNMNGLEDTVPKEDNCKFPHGGTAKKMQRADKNASLTDCIRMIGTIVDYDMKKDDVVFTNDEHQIKITDPEIPVNHPYVSYKVISRKPSNEYKPIVREETNECDEYNEQRGGTVFGQFFDCVVQFNIFATESVIADKLMDDFEELILNYTGFLKKEGVSEIYFKEQVTDSEYNNFRETLSVRNLRYYVKIEKLRVIFNRRLDDIEIYGDTVEKNKNNQGGML